VGRTRRVAAIVAVALSLLGTSAAHVATSSVPLRGTNWVLTDRSQLGAPLGDATMNAVFDASSVDGRSGCNGYRRSYTTHGASMSIADDGISTLIACEGPEGALERAYLARLGRVGHYRIAGTTLTLSTRGSRRLLVFRAAVGKRVLADRWNATSLYTGSAVSSPIPGSVVTLAFGELWVSGAAGCNTGFEGPVTLSGIDGIALGPLRTTLRACIDPGVSAQVDQYVQALELARTYRVTGNELTLFRADGTIAATFRRATGLMSGS
jgi:heat shock protein HslJ